MKFIPPRNQRRPALRAAMAAAVITTCMGVEAPRAADPSHSSSPGRNMSLVTVEPGSFRMGDVAPYNCQEPHEVTITRPFRIGQTEVTNAQYIHSLQYAYDRGLVVVSETSVIDNMGSTKEVLDLDDPECEIEFSDGEFFTKRAWNAIQWGELGNYDPAQHPVKEVTWFGAASFCDWRSLEAGFEPAYDHSTWECGPDGDPYEAEGYRLPTEAEWEYASRYPDNRRFPWGSDPPDCSRANYWPFEACAHWTEEVGSRPLGAQDEHHKKIFDLSGNVREWCNDRYRCRLGTIPVVDPVGDPTNPYRLVRGGSWDMPGFTLRASDRRGSRAFESLEFIGFRAARTAPQ